MFGLGSPVTFRIDGEVYVRIQIMKLSLILYPLCGGTCVVYANGSSKRLGVYLIKTMEREYRDC